MKKLKIATCKCGKRPKIIYSDATNFGYASPAIIKCDNCGRTITSCVLAISGDVEKSMEMMNEMAIKSWNKEILK